MNHLFTMTALIAAGIGSGRLVPTMAAVVSLIGVVLGGLALARSTGRTSSGTRRPLAIAAVIAGLLGVVVGGLHSANVAGGLGTGNGLAGGIVAIAVGLLGIVLGGLALARSRSAGVPQSPEPKQDGLDVKRQEQLKWTKGG